MLDLKRVQLKRYEDRIRNNQAVNFLNLSSIIIIQWKLSLTQRCFYYSAYTAKPKLGRITSSIVEVSIDLQESLSEVGVVDPYKFVDAMQLMDAFNSHSPILINYAARTGNRMPLVKYCPLPWLYLVFDFLKDFYKEKFPLVENWQEFILFLPQLRRNERWLTVSFADYTQAVRDGGFDRWYAQTKCGISNPIEVIDWRQRYIEQLQRMNEEQLQRELQRYNWGCKLVKEEIKKRIKTNKGKVLGATSS